MDLNAVNSILENEGPLRKRQAEFAIYKTRVRSWQDATSLPAELRQHLDMCCPVKFDAEIFRSDSDSSVKAILRLKDGLKIETVLLRHVGQSSRNTVCVSSQAGCALNCAFCKTGSIDFKRNLSFNEIVQQVLFFIYYLDDRDKVSQNVTNVVFMGMGEPLLNYSNVMEAVKIINDKEKINIGSRRISISTSGIPEGIEKLAGEKLQLNIAVSLNASDNDTRSKLMPVNLKYPLEKLFPAIRYYIKKTSRRVMIEYVLMKGINDRPGDSEKLSALLKRELGMGGLYFVNLIPFNGDEVFLSPAPAEIKRFKYYLEKHGIKTTQRYRFGKNISGACGQLVYQSDGTCPNDY